MALFSDGLVLSPLAFPLEEKKKAIMNEIRTIPYMELNKNVELGRSHGALDQGWEENVEILYEYFSGY